MDRYQRVEKPKAETPIDENEIRITSQGGMRNYITYAMTLLQEKGSNEIVFKALGRTINKTITIMKLIKRRIVGLHQNTQIGSTDITDIGVWFEGLQGVWCWYFGSYSRLSPSELVPFCVRRLSGLLLVGMKGERTKGGRRGVSGGLYGESTVNLEFAAAQN
ncbi:DNA/RNA-binding protein Alba-like protein [Corchorus olitorius]|uniref:DNA/RNA-binding protein Alba-like protein n=1 Tax=Corchorus olitorius TaxID=93759 RepID=A0A1R3K1D3_9ROSI|nr:DNA/RNA-binding protein Alba-like protein [Corchorus olitorius]